MDHRRRVIDQWKRGQDNQGVELEDGQVTVEVERAQVPAKDSILGKISKLSGRSTNFF